MKFGTAQIGRHVIRVAIEADLLARRVGQPERPRDFDPLLFGQNTESVVMLVTRRPDYVFVTLDHRPGRSVDRTMAITAETGRNAQMDAKSSPLRGRWRHLSG